MRPYRALLALATVWTAGCNEGGQSADEFLDALRTQGVTVAERTEVRSAMQQEFENIHEAMATGAPIPKLARRVTMNGVSADVFWCPGKAAQAESLVAFTLRGPHSGDPAFLGQAAEVLNGNLNLPAGDLVVSLAPTVEQDDKALVLAIAIARATR